MKSDRQGNRIHASVAANLCVRPYAAPLTQLLSARAPMTPLLGHAALYFGVATTYRVGGWFDDDRAGARDCSTRRLPPPSP